MYVLQIMSNIVLRRLHTTNIVMIPDFVELKITHKFAGDIQS